MSVPVPESRHINMSSHCTVVDDASKSEAEIDVSVGCFIFYISVIMTHFQLYKGESVGCFCVCHRQEVRPDLRAPRARLLRGGHLLRLLQALLPPPRHHRPLPPLREPLLCHLHGRRLRCDPGDLLRQAQDQRREWGCCQAKVR